jgi:hypothetical protein
MRTRQSGGGSGFPEWVRYAVGMIKKGAQSYGLER